MTDPIYFTGGGGGGGDLRVPYFWGRGHSVHSLDPPLGIGGGKVRGQRTVTRLTVM